MPWVNFSLGDLIALSSYWLPIGYTVADPSCLIYSSSIIECFFGVDTVLYIFFIILLNFMSIPGFDKKFSEIESLKKFSVPLCE